MRATDGSLHLSFFWNLCYIFICFRIFCIQYGGGSLLFRELSSSSDGSSVETRGFIGLLQQQEGVRVSGQGHMFGAAGPVKLDLDLEDFLEPGVRQLWRKQGFYWRPLAEFEDSMGLPSFLLQSL